MKNSKLLVILSLVVAMASAFASQTDFSVGGNEEAVFVNEKSARKSGDQPDKDIRSSRDAERAFKEFQKSFVSELAGKLSNLKAKRNYNSKSVLKTYTEFLREWQREGLLTNSVVEASIKKAKRERFSNPKADAKRLSQFALQTKQKVKIGEACSPSLNNCEDAAFCRRIRKIDQKKVVFAHQCVRKVALENRCDPNLNQCESGSCKLLLRYTDVNLCKTYGEQCKGNSDCCSGSCNSQSRCDADYKCTSCLGIGNKVSEAQKCCAGLYPNENNICEPIMPVFGGVLKWLNIIITPSHASLSGDVSKAKSEVSSLINKLGSTLSSAGVPSSTKNSIISNYNSQKSNCYDSERNNLSQELSCLNGMKTTLKSAISQAEGINSYLDQFNDEVDNLRKEASEINSMRGDNASVNRLVSHHVSQKRNCLSRMSMWSQGTRSYTQSITSVKNCLNSVNNSVKSDANDITNNINQLKMQLHDKGNSTEFISQGVDQSDYSLYDFYDNDAPILGNIAVSDMANCRVNLFGDYLVKQTDDYFNVMITLLGMDFVTGSGGVSDYFTVDNWRMQTQTQEQDIETFDADNIKKDIFQSYANDIKKIVKDYYKTLNAEEKIIWGFLFNNGRVNAKEKQAILKYFVENDKSRLETDLSNFEAPEPNEYNIHKITRFEAVKYKFHLYQLYGKLKRKSIEMTCRCVDTVGPMKGDEWLQPDVEKLYINSCRGIGKYDKFVLVQDESCTTVDESGTCVNAQSKDFTNKVLEKAELKHGTQNISGTKTNKAGKETVTFKNTQNRDVKGEVAGDVAITTLNNLKRTEGKHSKADKFIKGAKVTFEAERKENTKGRGEGLVFSEFLRDMSIMKVQALSEAATNNVFSMSTSLTLTSQFVRTFNWGYQKTKVHHYVKVKKYTWPQLILAWLVQLIGGNDGSGQAGHFISGALGSVTFEYDGQNKSLQSAIKDSLTSLHLRPERICEKRKFKSSTWKKSRIPIGKKYYYKCIYNEILPNDVCNAKLPVGLCLKTVYATNYEGDSSFILDPFVPEGTSIIKDDKFLQRKVVRTLTDSQIESIKLKASEYLKDQFFDFSDAEAKQFGDFVFRYHFWYPKKSRLIRYMTQGLIPYYERLTEKAFNVNMAIYDDLFSTASYALKMHNFYYNVDRGVRNGLLMGQEQLEKQEYNIESTGTPELVDYMAGLGNKGVIKDGRINFNNRSDFNEDLNRGIQSDNKDIREFAGALNNSFNQAEARNKRRKRLEDFMTKSGRGGELDRMKKAEMERNKEFDLMSKNFAASVRKTANQRSQFDDKKGLFDFSKVAARTLGPSSYGKRKNSESSTEASELEKLVNEPISLSKKKKGKKKGSKDKGGETAIANSDLDELDLSDLENDELGEYSFGEGGETIAAQDIKRYFKKEKIGDEYNNNSNSNPDSWRNDERGLFEKLSERYKKTAYPRFLVKKKAK
jgi:hypothetical protein